MLKTAKARTFFAIVGVTSTVALSACGGGDEVQPDTNPTPTSTPGYTYVRPPGSTPMQENWWPQELRINNDKWVRSGASPATGADAEVASPTLTYTNEGTAVTLRYQESMPRGADGVLVSRESTLKKEKSVQGTQRTPAGGLTCVLPVGAAAGGNVTVLCAGKAAQEFPGIFIAETTPMPGSADIVRGLVDELQQQTGFKAAVEGGLKNELGVTSEGVAFTRQYNNDYTMTTRGGFRLNYKFESRFAPLKVKSNSESPDNPKENLVAFYSWNATVRNLTEGFPTRIPAAFPSVMYTYPATSPVCKLTYASDRSSGSANIPFADKIKGSNYCAVTMLSADFGGSGNLEEGESFSYSNQGDNRKPTPEKEMNVIPRAVPAGTLEKMLPELEKPTHVMTYVTNQSNDFFQIVSGECKINLVLGEDNNTVTEDAVSIPRNDKVLCDLFAGDFIEKAGSKAANPSPASPTTAGATPATSPRS